MIETSKVVDVLLLLGGKQHSYARGHMLCLHYTLCLMQLSVVRNLILSGCSDDIPGGGLLVIDAVGWRSMYFVVMPRVNLIVILVTYARYLYSINCPTVICLLIRLQRIYIFDALCLFLHHLPNVSLHFVALLCIFRN